MNIKFGNLRTFTALGDKEKMEELENKIKALGYRNEDNCKKNDNTDNLTWHIYDMPRVIAFSVLTKELVTLLQSYTEYFTGSVAVTANKNLS